MLCEKMVLYIKIQLRKMAQSINWKNPFHLSLPGCKRNLSNDSSHDDGDWRCDQSALVNCYTWLTSLLLLQAINLGYSHSIGLINPGQSTLIKTVSCQHCHTTFCQSYSITVPWGVRYRPALYCSRYIISSINLFKAGSLLLPVDRLQ